MRSKLHPKTGAIAMTNGLMILVLAIFFIAGKSAVDAQTKEVRIAVVGAPEEPRFSDIVLGLKKGLGELGYAPPSLVVYETKIARGGRNKRQTFDRKLTAE